MSWGNGRRGSPDPALVTCQWKQHRVYWKRQRLPCARCGGWIDYDGPRGRARAQKRLPVEVRQQLLDGIYSGQPFRRVLRDLGLTSNQVWGLTKTDDDWSAALEATLTATRRDDLQHGTSAAYAQGCVCSECRAHQRIRMARHRD
jgi:hypothetical protein